MCSMSSSIMGATTVWACVLDAADAWRITWTTGGAARSTPSTNISMPNAAWSMKNESSEIPTSNSPRKTGIEMRTDFRFQLRSQAVSSETLVAELRILGQIESKSGTEIRGWALMSQGSLPGCIALFCAGLSVQTVHAC